MPCPIRPGKVTCAGIVAIMLVLPNSIWKGPDTRIAPTGRPTGKHLDGAGERPDSGRRAVKFRKVAR